MLTHSKVLIFNLEFIPGVFCKTLIVDCAVSLQAVMAHYVYLAGYIQNKL